MSQTYNCETSYTLHAFETTHHHRRMMKNRSESISARVSYETKQELDRIAAEEQRSLSQVVALAVEKGLEAWRAEGRRKKRPRKA